MNLTNHKNLTSRHTGSKAVVGSFLSTLRKAVCVGLSVAVLSACSSTGSDVEQAILLEPVDPVCRQSAMKMQASAENTGIKAQYLLSAKELRSCVRQIPAIELSNEQKQDALQVMAMASLNYLKGGDVKQANSVRETMKSQFPGQDLYFADFTSFSDTLTALIDGHKLTAQELASLNISRQVREEVERQQYWLTH